MTLSYIFINIDVMKLIKLLIESEPQKLTILVHFSRVKINGGWFDPPGAVVDPSGKVSKWAWGRFWAIYS